MPTESFKADKEHLRTHGVAELVEQLVDACLENTADEPVTVFREVLEGIENSRTQVGGLSTPGMTVTGTFSSRDSAEVKYVSTGTQTQKAHVSWNEFVEEDTVSRRNSRRESVLATGYLKGALKTKSPGTFSVLEAVYSSVVRVAAKSAETAWVRRYNPKLSADFEHQMVVTMKPELTDLGSGVDVSGALEFVAFQLMQADMHVGAIRVLGGEYMQRTNLISEHYGIISNISRRGREALSVAGDRELEKRFGAELARGVEVLGAHELLDKNVDCNALMLAAFSDNLGCVKLASGAFAIKATVGGIPYIVLNPFHPLQYLHFTKPGNTVVALEVFTNHPWKFVREEVCGDTDPHQAKQGSIRHWFAEAREFYLEEVSTSRNCIHISAGPLEGMAELCRFFSDSMRFIPWSDTTFGKTLQQEHALSDADLAELAGNLELKDSSFDNISAFDLTENVDAKEAASILKAHFVMLPPAPQNVGSWDPLDVQTQLNKVCSKSSLIASSWVREYDPELGRQYKHQCVLLLKHCLLDAQGGVDLLGVLKEVQNYLTKAKVEVGAVRILGIDYLRRHGILEEQLMLIGSIARYGLAALTPEAKTTLEKTYKDELANGAEVLGAQQFLALVPEVSAAALDAFNEMGNTRLASGTYSIVCTVQGRRYVVLNPFYPYQLQNCLHRERAMVALEGLSNQPWQEIINTLWGGTWDTTHKNTLRHAIWNSDYGVKKIHALDWGMYISAGPLEGMVEVARYFLKPPSAQADYNLTSFGHQLLALGISQEDIRELAGNVYVPIDQDGGKWHNTSAFEVTKFLDAESASIVLKAAVDASKSSFLGLERELDLSPISNAVSKVSASQSCISDIWIQRYDASLSEGYRHQFLIWLKPELTSNGVDLPSILDYMKQALESMDVHIGAIRVVGGAYIEKANIVTEHYSTISNISRHGKVALSPAAKEQLDLKFAKALKNKASVLGAHELLGMEKDVTAKTLAALSDNMGCVRLGMGAYALKACLNGKPHIILNPFHPQQVINFTKLGSSTVAMEAFTNISWSAIRDELCGTTDPSKAQVGSIRRTLWEQREAFHIPELNWATNGIHMSAGPLEGMVELLALFAEDFCEQKGIVPIWYPDTVLGRLLMDKGLGELQIHQLSQNPVVALGSLTTAFEVTEGMDIDGAVATLVNLMELGEDSFEPLSPGSSQPLERPQAPLRVPVLNGQL